LDLRALPAVTASYGSCLDHLEIRRQAQAVGAAAQVSFQRFLRAEMHDVAEARIDKRPDSARIVAAARRLRAGDEGA
jgi:hypothetical protein